jgi:deoxyribodipyrimidine photo-lyase
MTSAPISSDRIQVLNGQDIRPGAYVLYWMQQSQRAWDNHALEYAIELANHLKLPVFVVFGLMDSYPEANLRHYTFMIEGLRETQAALAERGIGLAVRKGHPAEVALEAAAEAACVVCDRGYLRHQRQWREKAARKADCRFVQVESDVVVPLAVVSGKAEYAARTIRPKIQRQLDKHLIKPTALEPKKTSRALSREGLSLDKPARLLASLSLDDRVAPVSQLYRGGAGEARKRFDRFVRQKLVNYDKHSNQPQTDDISHMSMYLHFGQISPIHLALAVQNADAPQEARDAYLEELIVRRELAINFAYYTPDYDAYSCLPGWAESTLAQHAEDKRPDLYTRRQLESAKTHDPYWNAAMREMKFTGFMHNYMRMYWGKKILQWSKSPKTAFRTTLAINNRYFIDGRDPNSYTGVAWIYGVHDRAWKERPIFGKVRYMAASGLERKCDIKGYVEKVDRLVKRVSR